MKFKTIILLIFLFCMRKAYCDRGDTNTNLKVDTNLIIKEIRHTQIIDNLDSLLNLWYVKHSLINQDDYDYIDIDTTDTIVPVLSDSVYIERLKNFPSLIPLSYNERVRAFIELYAYKRRKQVQVMLGLKDYYFPLFERVLDMYNLPFELKYLPIIESALNPRAVSRAGATGIWQFMYTTGRLYGLEINSFVDERLDPVSSTYAAVKYLKDLYDIYHDWLLVVAAYNCGPGNVNKAIRRSGGKKRIWEIYYRLPRETRGYVPAFIAAIYIMNYYKEHKLYARKIEIPHNIDTLLITQPLHLQQVADVLNIPLKQIRELNPKYRRDIIPAIKDTYVLNLPFNKIKEFIVLKDSIFNYKDSVFFNKNIVIKPTRRYREYYYVPPPPGKNYSKVYYTVKKGDNLGFIAQWFNVRISQLRYWNNIRGNIIRSGQRLLIYVPANKVKCYKKIDLMNFAEKEKLNKSPCCGYSNNKDDFDSEYIYYIVKPGDSLWKISQKFPDVSVNDIKLLNDIKEGQSIKPGDKLKIKKKI